jgi:hypothetical protein
MLLEGSCSCGAVKFSVETHTPYPYMHCYCSICRKTAGGGGYAINIMGGSKTLEVKGRKNLSVYRARIEGTASHARRHFCSQCGSALWVWDPRWGEWVYPFASAIDTPLPKPPEVQHILLEFKAPWVEVPRGKKNLRFGAFPEESIADWHRKRKLVVK